MSFLSIARLSVVSGAALAASPSFAADWMQFGYDAAHSGNNTAETILTRANIAKAERRYASTLPASVDGAPVYLSNVATSGGEKDLLFLLATNGTLMAVDALDGSVVWSHQVTGRSPTTSSPAIDPGREYVYAYGLDGFVHKYHVGNGNEVTSGGWPELVTLKTDVEKVAGSLTIATSGATTYLYVVTDGYAGDFGNYQGHLTTINLANGHQDVFNSQCSDEIIHFDDSNDCAWPMPGPWGRRSALCSTAGRSLITHGRPSPPLTRRRKPRLRRRQNRVRSNCNFLWRPVPTRWCYRIPAAPTGSNSRRSTSA